MSSRSISSRGRRGGTWNKVAIFISLYVLLLESLIQWVLVLYLYGNKQTDSKMAPSLILAFIASFFTLPLLALHSLLAWQYNRGILRRRTTLRAGCTYLLRSTITIWLAASVAGLVVVTQHASCLPDGANASFWKAGVSCAIHRASVIVSVLAFITVCLYFCSRELCERPYDVSLLGIYRPPLSIRKDRIVSSSSLGSERSLKKDILCICRGPDVTYGSRFPCMSGLDGTNEKSLFTSNIQHPTPVRPRPVLQLDTDPDAVLGENLSGTTASPGGTLFSRNPSNASCTPTIKSSGSLSASHLLPLPELPSGVEVMSQPNHQRHKSSSSSLRKILPKSIPVSIPLSADPQIRALFDPSPHVDLEKQDEQESHDHVETSTQLIDSLPEQKQPPHQQPQETVQNPLPEQIDQRTGLSSNPPFEASLPRSITTNSAEAPEVTTNAPASLSQSSVSGSGPVPRTAYYPPPRHSSIHPKSPLASQRPQSSSWANLLDASRRPTRIHTMRTVRQQNHFDPSHIPRYTQSQRHPRSSSLQHNRLYRQSSRNLSRSRNDAELHYQGSGRRRSSICGVRGGSFPSHLDSIRESGQSIDEPATYRGANRTGVHGQ